jgi:hypothetical protein
MKLTCAFLLLAVVEAVEVSSYATLIPTVELPAGGIQTLLALPTDPAGDDSYGSDSSYSSHEDSYGTHEGSFGSLGTDEYGSGIMLVGSILNPGCEGADCNSIPALIPGGAGTTDGASEDAPYGMPMFGAFTPPKEASVGAGSGSSFTPGVEGDFPMHIEAFEAELKQESSSSKSSKANHGSIAFFSAAILCAALVGVALFRRNSANTEASLSMPLAADMV